MTTREVLDSLPHLPRDEEGPVFREPWEAQAFAMAVAQDPSLQSLVRCAAASWAG